MLTPNGGVFGRNPKFQNVTVENNLTVNGDFTLGDDIVINDTLLVNGVATFRGGIVSTPNATAPTSNTVMGSSAGALLEAGAVNNILIGSGAGDAITTGDNSVAIGVNALGANQTSSDCVAVGNSALLLGTGASNVAIGSGAADALTTGNNVVAIGLNALGAATTSIDHVAVGSGALAGTTTGERNTAVGRAAMSRSTGSTDCTVIGRNTLNGNGFSGNYNVAVGSSAGEAVADGSQFMTLVGAFAMQSCTGNATGTTAVGFYAGLSLTTATNNTIIGSQAARNVNAGTAVTSLTNSVIIGQDARPAANAQTNQIVIGDAGRGNGSNTTTISNTSTTDTYLVGTATSTVIASGDKVRIANSKTPATAGAAGTAGDICWDADYIYVCVAANTWKRVSIATWP